MLSTSASKSVGVAARGKDGTGGSSNGFVDGRANSVSTDEGSSGNCEWNAASSSLSSSEAGASPVCVIAASASERDLPVVVAKRVRGGG